ncbi:hypothetical protein OY671_012815, partial [Metschnikowia pulcherrima]
QDAAFDGTRSPCSGAKPPTAVTVSRDGERVQKTAAKLIRARYSAGDVRIPPRHSMRSFTIAVASLVLAVCASAPAHAQNAFGPVGEEGEPYRKQQWRSPSPDADTPARGLSFRPPGNGPFRSASIAHATTQN